jgi:hypothetical protein
MTNVVDFLAYAGRAAQKAAAPKPGVEKSQADPALKSLYRQPEMYRETTPGAGSLPAISANGRRESVLALLTFQLPDSYIVGDDGRDYVEDLELHEQCRDFFDLFGFDLAKYKHADNIRDVWLTLSSFYVFFVRIAIEEPPHFEVMSAGYSDDWRRYIRAVAAGDAEIAKQLSTHVQLGTNGF